jgi:hypothetical protein
MNGDWITRIALALIWAFMLAHIFFYTGGFYGR